MNVRKFVAPTVREALRLLKEDLGADAIVLSNRSVDGGVELTALPPQAIEDLEALAPSRDAAPHPDIDEAYTVSLSGGARPAAGNRPVPQKTPEAKAPEVREWNPARLPEREPAMQAGGIPADQGRLVQEMAEIRNLIEQQLAGFAWGSLARSSPGKTLLMADLLDAGFSGLLARRLVEGLPAGAARDDGRDWVKGMLNRSLVTLGSEEEIIDRGGVYALVGPTGVGKTTTTAKLAARCVVRHGAERVALLTTDGYRIGAHEQLRIYGRILGVHVHAVRDAADLRQTLADLAGKHMVLIDTIGMSQRDRMVAEQAAMLAQAGDVRRLLLLNATCRGDTLDDVVRAYGAADMAGAVLTKVDEAASLAPALDALIRHDLKLYYVANGQRVPEDLHLPNRPYLLHRALKGAPEDSPHHLCGDEPGLLLAAGAGRGETARMAHHG